MFRYKIAFFIYFSLFLLSCAAVDNKKLDTKGIPLSANIADNDIFVERKYTSRSNQGDHFEELVKNGYFRKAARLYNRYYGKLKLISVKNGHFLRFALNHAVSFSSGSIILSVE